VVCGLGNIGYRVVEQLAPLGVSLVAVELDRSNRFLPAMQRLGVPGLARDSRLRDTLETLQVTSDLTVVVTRQRLAEALAHIEASENLGHKA
jgi:Trk K+ transport system NAD-binding subunit